MREFDVLGEYAIYFDYESVAAIVGHIHHVKRNEAGTQLQVPVARFAAYLSPGDDVLRTHWAIDLFLRSDVRYDPTTRETTVVANPERQAGSNRALLRALERIRDSNLQFCHSDLPKELAQVLLRESNCSEPALINIHHSYNDSFFTYGVLHDE
ncbi:MAG TPA: hypothetical protein VJM12_16200 [Pyrinomonadaceae bacterium]|nr:hypothetical protein [Pyrinomonadaceae bacterium]